LAKHKKANTVPPASKSRHNPGKEILCTHTPTKESHTNTQPQYSITSMKTPLKRLESALATLNSKAHQKEILQGISNGGNPPERTGL